MSHKSKGINAERDLIHMFWGSGWSAVRVAGSGSMKYPAPDIIAGTRDRKIVIECKACRDKYQYFDKEEVEQLSQFAARFNAEPFVAIKFDRKEWFFLKLNDLKQTKNRFVADSGVARERGISFLEMLGQKI